MFSVAGRSDVGSSKSVNQDAWCALVAQTDVGDVVLSVVADGVGGLASGELASSTVVHEFSDWFETAFPAYAASCLARDGEISLTGVAEQWNQLLRRLNARISAWGREHGARLGTTFTGMLVCQGRYVIGQVGDCRLYRIRDGRADQLTQDQTLAARAVQEGTVTKEEALRMPQGSVLLQSVGTQTELRPEFTYGEAREGDLFVSCCDGFYRRLGDEGVRAAYASVDPRDEAALLAVTNRLIQQDIAQGEKDNLTAVCLALVGDEDPTTVVTLGDDEPTTVAADDEPTTVVPEPEDEPTVVVDAPAVPDDATTLLTGDEHTSSLEGGEGPWRA